ncbi:mandelate racemase/muconate lactonizing enzyme family protein [Aurantimonas sp. A3-2-R12]|uniref:mandelate racemase/muconate lactonizing enzyme family protein n=1 Tax=Aurantimonas sp. A3-2-R12 TaxID=3114362 RepID=UPI002E17EA02|nr:mandelate racemase/muconate lactonizing enzyme family protein [Aurantimonas sp. A3-2-R12]
MAKIQRATLRRLGLPLIRPYRLSYRTFESFEPFLVEVEDDDGRSGFADGHISPGSSAETRDGGWAFLCESLQAAIGVETVAVKASVLDRFATSKVAATAFATAIEVLEANPLLDLPDATILPLLTPLNALEPAAIAEEIEAWLAQGFGTFKVKVGKDVDADLQRVAVIQEATRGRATLRLDANRAYSREDGERFASRLDPEGIELFEQPCDADDWDANAAVAAVSRVPLMLDEPICTLADIDRAATITGVGYCKLKLKRFGGLDRLKQGLDAVRQNGMEPVLGDGLGSEIHGWLEACVARTTIRNACEFNGFLKPRDRLFVEPMPFREGAIRLPAGYRPRLDRDAVERFTLERRDFE